jgi:hypothetical protein
MSLLKKCDANNRLLASRNKSQHSFRLVRHADRANSSKIKPDGPWAGKLAFVEDFTREHSLPGLQVTSIGISGSF